MCGINDNSRSTVERERTAVIDAVGYLRPRIAAAHDPRVVWWPSSMAEERETRLTIGLIEGGFDQSVADLDGAGITVRWFGGGRTAPLWFREHGAFSASLLVGQGIFRLRGTVPRARLNVACTASADGVIRPDDVATAIRWLTSSGADVIVIPLGQPDAHAGLTAALRAATHAGIAVIAAAGNSAAGPILFPASDPRCLAVGACTATGVLRPGCVSEPRVDLFVRGDRVRAPVRGRLLRTRSGTSVACVLAGGLATTLMTEYGRTAAIEYLARRRKSVRD
ncbi:S8 family serine peptidase [Nocardia sp. NPDC060220]|uniref:S8 family serine peptidase n=1 Tax=Nocardia sp. NPDC060220 TaxID=3347076 RepID=UPI003669E564